MIPRARRWIHFKQTYVLLELWDDERIPEWQPVGYVMRRQIYQAHNAMWQVWTTDGTQALLNQNRLLRDAKLALERYLDERRGYLRPITEPGRG